MRIENLMRMGKRKFDFLKDIETLMDYGIECLLTVNAYPIYSYNQNYQETTSIYIGVILEITRIHFKPLFFTNAV